MAGKKALYAGLFSLVAFLVTGNLPAEVVKKGAVPDKKPALNPKAPPGKKAVDPKAAADRARIEQVKLRLADWEKSGGVLSRHGLDLAGFLAPDALAYKAASSYLRFRASLLTHKQAIDKVALSLPRWKRYEGQSLFLLKIANPLYKQGKQRSRIYTQSKGLGSETLIIRDAKKRRLKGKLAGLPANLRLANLRLKKFWQTGDGITRLVCPGSRDGLLRNPGSIGRKAKLSKPFKAWVLEKGPAELEVLVKRSLVESSKSRLFRLSFESWKIYEGPWEGDLLDLNENRSWKELASLPLEIRLPPGGLSVSPALQAIIDEAAAR
mgnify:CR=1 FL=1